MSSYHDYFVYRDGDLWWSFTKRGLVHTRPVGQLNKGYRWTKCPISGKRIGVHRIIWTMLNGPIPDGMVIDHIDRNPLNNRIENLRIASRSQNCHNAKSKGNKLAELPKNVAVDWKYKGIIKYRLQTTVNGKSIRVGNLSLEEAMERLQEFRSRYHGEYAT